MKEYMISELFSILQVKSVSDNIRCKYHEVGEVLIIFMAIIIFTNYNYFRKAWRIEINILT